MKYKPEDEQALLEDVLSFAYDPVGFVRYIYPWGEPGTPLETVPGPRAWQMEFLEAVRDHVQRQSILFDLDRAEDALIYKEAIASGRGIGKTALLAMLSHWQVSCHLGAHVLVTANTESQMRSATFPEFGRWFQLGLNAHWWDVESLAVRPQAWLSRRVQDELRIDDRYWGVAGKNWTEENPDAFVGPHNSYGLALIMDEASGIPEPIWTAASGFFTEMNPFRFWIAFSNPRRNSGAFFDRFHHPDIGHGWRRKQIDARTVKEVEQSIFESTIRAYGPDSDQARVEVYGQFPEQGEGQLIANSVVREAQRREISPAEDNDEPIIMGVDPAPRGRTVIRFRQGRDAKTFPVVELNGADNTAIADKIVELNNQYDCDAIVVDQGLGTGVIDELKRRRVHAIEVGFGFKPENPEGEWGLRGGELWGALRDWLPTGCIDDSPRLFNDLTKRTWKWYGGREDGKKTLNSKREMAKEGTPSPDDADALALTFAPRLPRRSVRARRLASPSQVPIAAGLDAPLL